MSLISRLRSTLTYPIAAILVLVTVVPVALVGLLLARSNREHLTTEQKRSLTRQAVSLASEVSLFYDAHKTQLESSARALEAGGTLAVYLGCDALERGFDATIVTYNMQVFDPTWFAPGVDIAERLRAQAEIKKDRPKVQVATAAYLLLRRDVDGTEFDEVVLEEPGVQA